MTETILVEAVDFGQRYVAECTPNDPPSMAGILAWGKTQRRLRDLLMPSGWEPDNAFNYATVVHPMRSHGITTPGGDVNTGLPNKTPSTKSEKGPVTKSVVGVNRQMSFAEYKPELADQLPPVPKASAKETWMLIQYRDEDAELIRSELSLPTGISESGWVYSWRERIILNPISLSGQQPITNVGPDSGSGGSDLIDVAVKRKETNA